jgi:hypothetical protein
MRAGHSLGESENSMNRFKRPKQVRPALLTGVCAGFSNTIPIPFPPADAIS